MPDFKYRPLADHSCNIRLVQILPSNHAKDDIHLKLFEVSLENRPSYIALSYAWGAPRPGRAEGWVEAAHTIFIEEQEVRVRLNLFSALQHLRAPILRVNRFWIDALCINQSDLDEKSQQVMQMKEIYAKAKETIIWLGDDQGSCETAFVYLNQTYEASQHPRALEQVELRRRVHGEHQKDELSFQVKESGRSVQRQAQVPLQVGESDKALDALRNARNLVRPIGSEPDLVEAFRILFSHTWFERSWVIQEVSVSKNAWVMCGRNMAPWSAAKTLCEALQAYKSTTYTTYAGDRQYVNVDDEIISVLGRDAYQAQRVAEICDNHRLAQIHTSKYRQLIDTLEQAQPFKATDPRDKIYSVLGLGGSDLVKPDYKRDVSEVFTLFARQCIEHENSLYILAIAGIFSSLPSLEEDDPHESLPDLPSWAPNWAARKHLAKKFLIPFFFNASRNCLPKFRFSDTGIPTLFVNGYIIDDINFIGESLYSRRMGKTIPETFEMFSNSARNMHRTLRDLYMSSAGQHALPDNSDLEIEGRPDALFSHDHVVYPPTNEHLSRAITETFMTDTCFFGLPGSMMTPQTFWDNRGRPSKRPDLWRRLCQNPSVAFDLMYAIMSNRRAMLSDKLFIGLAPSGSKKGDVISIILGENAPYVLRLSPNGQYYLVGQCYVHGLMDGEAIEMANKGGMDVQEIALI